MKYKDKICDAFEALGNELDAKYDQETNGVRDLDSINIDDIENKIMEKIDKMVETKLNSMTPEPNEPDTHDQAENKNIENNGGDNNED